MTSTDPVAAAEAARHAMRTLAHATLAAGDPDQTYRLLASLTSAITSLGQVLDQIADTLTRHAAMAADPTGDPTAGRQIARAAASGLYAASLTLTRAGEQVDQAWSHTGQLVWPDPSPPPPSPTPVRPAHWPGRTDPHLGDGPSL
jgi:hypothetical protein